MIYLVLIVFVLVGSAMALLALQNVPTEVQLTLFIWHVPRFPLGVLLVAAFLLGALLLYVVSTLSALQERREVKKLRARVAELEQIAAKSPGSPLQRTFSQSASIVPIPGTPPSSQNK
jgi:uncharacterized integral membrane protein